MLLEVVHIGTGVELVRMSAHCLSEKKLNRIINYRIGEMSLDIMIGSISLTAAKDVS